MKISLITACRNVSGVIGDSLESVKKQTGDFQFEHLFQDGGSTDGTLALLEGYRASVDYAVSIRSEPDGGYYDAVNQGVRRATGDVIGLLNADDWLASGEVLKAVAGVFERDAAVDVVYADIEYFRENRGGSPRFTRVRQWRAGRFAPGKFRRGWMPPHPTVYVRRGVYDQAGPYRLDMGTAGDYEWLLRVLMGAGSDAGRVVYLPKVMVHMRLGGQSNVSLKNRLAANRMDRKAWEVNGLKPSPGFRLLKPLGKMLQWR